MSSCMLICDDLQNYHWAAVCAIDLLASRQYWDQPSIRGQQTAGQENDCGTGRWRVYMLGFGGFVDTVHTVSVLPFCCATFLLDSWCNFSCDAPAFERAQFSGLNCVVMSGRHGMRWPCRWLLASSWRLSQPTCCFLATGQDMSQ